VLSVVLARQVGAACAVGLLETSTHMTAATKIQGNNRNFSAIRELFFPLSPISNRDEGFQPPNFSTNSQVRV
jgi:hypothetical protein